MTIDEPNPQIVLTPYLHMGKKLRNWENEDFITARLKIKEIENQIAEVIARTDLREEKKDELIDTLFDDKYSEQSKIKRAEAQLKKYGKL